MTPWHQNLMDHEFLLASKPFYWSIELSLDYYFFFPSLMSLLDRAQVCQSSITDFCPLGDCFPSFCSVELISVMCFSVYVYRRLKGLFVFPLVALWLVSSQTCLKHCYRRPDAFFHWELLNHVSSPSPEFQMQAVEKLAIASAWQVGSISVLSPRKAWASSRPLGTAAGCALVRVRLLGH